VFIVGMYGVLKDEDKPQLSAIYKVEHFINIVVGIMTDMAGKNRVNAT
jgi:hypothetical protein